MNYFTQSGKIKPDYKKNNKLLGVWHFEQTLSEFTT
jgi:hypothetical protein